jgi:hypothetical protein
MIARLRDRCADSTVNSAPIISLPDRHLDAVGASRQRRIGRFQPPCVARTALSAWRSGRSEDGSASDSVPRARIDFRIIRSEICQAS